MMKLGSLTRWVPVSKAPLKFLNPNPRLVRIEVNTPEEVVLFVSDAGKRHFLGRFDGYDVVQFGVSGPFELSADGSGAMIWTPELEDRGAVEIPEAVSFARIATRKARNPELELLMHKMNVNMERRIAQVEKDVTLRVAQERRIALAEAHREALERSREEEAERIDSGEPSAEDAGEDETASAESD